MILLKDEVVLLGPAQPALVLPLLILVGEVLHRIKQTLLALARRFEAVSDPGIHLGVVH